MVSGWVWSVLASTPGPASLKWSDWSAMWNPTGFPSSTAADVQGSPSEQQECDYESAHTPRNTWPPSGKWRVCESELFPVQHHRPLGGDSAAPTSAAVCSFSVSELWLPWRRFTLPRWKLQLPSMLPLPSTGFGILTMFFLPLTVLTVRLLLIQGVAPPGGS